MATRRYVYNINTKIPYIATPMILNYLHKRNQKHLRLMPDGWKPGDSVDLDPIALQEVHPDVLKAISDNLSRKMPEKSKEEIRMLVAEAAGGQLPPPEEDRVELPDPMALQEVVAAISDLDPKHPDHYTVQGKPDSKVLTELLGRRVSASERDQAFELYRAQTNQ